MGGHATTRSTWPVGPWPGLSGQDYGSPERQFRGMAEVEVTRDGAVLTITLNRPDVLNAFNPAMHEGIAAALEEARDPTSARS